MEDLYLMLISAHIIGDFLLQPGWMAKGKREVKVLALHAFIHALLAYCLVGGVTLWILIIAVFILHFAIDYMTVRCAPKLSTLLVDQALHLLTIFLFVSVLVRVGYEAPWYPDWVQDLIIMGAGFVATVFAVGIVVSRVTQHLIDDNPDLEQELANGLKSGGMYIGWVERGFIFVLMMMGQFTAIGLLLLAKAAFRFEVSKQRVMGEYVLIGTLCSIGLALAISYLTTLCL